MNPLVLAVVLAQAAPAAVPAGETATVPLLVLAIAAAIYCFKTKGHQWPGLMIGIAIGVLGNGTFVGTMTHSVIDIITQLLNQLGSSIHSTVA